MSAALDNMSARVRLMAEVSGLSHLTLWCIMVGSAMKDHCNLCILSYPQMDKGVVTLATVGKQGAARGAASCSL